MGAAFLIGIALVCVAAFALTLLPPSRVGAAASWIRLAAAGLLGAMGVVLESRGLVLPGLALLALGAVILMRRRSKLGAGNSSGGQGAGTPSGAGRMSVAEAYSVLGLDASANNDDIRRAHHDLMQKIHPDHGGTSYLAAKLNQARETLLARDKG